MFNEVMDYLNAQSSVTVGLIFTITALVLVILSIYIVKFAIPKMVARMKHIKKLKEAKKLKKSKLNVKQQIVYKDRFLDSNLTELKNLSSKKFYYEAKDRDFFEEDKGWIAKYIQRKLKKKYPDKIVLIRMEMNNGHYKEFLVKEDENDGFKHDKKKYIFDLDAKYFVINTGKAGTWAYDYHESLTLPVKRTIPVNAIKSTMEQSNITEVENAINPVTLERFIKSEIAQGILQGAMIGKLFKVMLILIIIALVVNGIDLVIDLMDSGVMAQILEKAK